MVNADLNVGDGANNKQSRPIKDGNYYKVNVRKVLLISKFFIKI